MNKHKQNWKFKSFKRTLINYEKVRLQLLKKNVYGYDLRQNYDFKEKHIPNSKNIKVNKIQEKILTHKKMDKIILIGEYERSCSSTAAWARAQGYKRVFLLKGGLKDIELKLLKKKRS